VEEVFLVGRPRNGRAVWTNQRRLD